MNTTSDQLRLLQLSLQNIITQPNGALAEGWHEAAGTLVHSNGSLDAGERVNIYHRSYYARLFECFEAEFPCFKYAIGADLFRAFFMAYLQKYPPESFTLHELSSRFPNFLEETRPDAGLPAEEKEHWPSFLIELSLLERTFSQIYSAEDGQLTAKALKFEYPILDFYRAWKADENLELPSGPLPQTVLVYREAYWVKSRQIDLLEFEQYRAI